MLLTFSALEAQQTLQWSFFHPLRSEWIDLGESGSVQEALIESGELPDPFYGLNEAKFGWIEDHEWKFKAIFFIDTYDKNQSFALHFEGIDTYAQLSVNGKKIALTICEDLWNVEDDPMYISSPMEALVKEKRNEQLL